MRNTDENMPNNAIKQNRASVRNTATDGSDENSGDIFMTENLSSDTRSSGQNGELSRKLRARKAAETAIKIALAFFAVTVLAYAIVGLKIFADSKKIKSHEEKALAILSAINAPDSRDYGFSAPNFPAPNSPDSSDSSGSDSGKSDSDKSDSGGTNSPQNSPAETFRNFSAALETAQKESAQAKNISNSFAWKIARFMPFIGSEARCAQSMTSAVHSVLTDVIPEFAGGGEKLLSVNLNDRDKSFNIENINAATEKITNANSSLEKIISQFDNSDKSEIPSVKKAHKLCRRKLGELHKRTSIYEKAAKALPILTGVNAKQTFIMAAMNNAEARSSGGLIGAVGSISAKNGIIETGDFLSNDMLVQTGKSDANEEELNVFNKTGPFSYSMDVRDAAAYPDTERVAKALVHVWNSSEYGRENQATGVILADPVFLQRVTGATSDITMPDGRVLTGTNTAEFLMNKIYSEIPSQNSQNVYFQQIANKIISQFFSGLKSENIAKMIKIFSQSAKERHFNAYSENPDVEDFFNSTNISASSPGGSNSALNASDNSNSDDNTLADDTPAVGIYVNQQRPSKLDWYVRHSAKIKLEPSDSNSPATLQPGDFKRLKRSKKSKCRKDKPRTYRVSYSMQNTITTEEAQNGPEYVTGTQSDGYAKGTAVEKVLIYPPAGGKVENISISKNSLIEPEQMSMDGKFLWLSAITLEPQETATYEFDVTVPAVKSDEGNQPNRNGNHSENFGISRNTIFSPGITLDRTPSGQFSSPADMKITYDLSACSS